MSPLLFSKSITCMKHHKTTITIPITFIEVQSNPRQIKHAPDEVHMYIVTIPETSVSFKYTHLTQISLQRVQTATDGSVKGISYGSRAFHACSNHLH